MKSLAEKALLAGWTFPVTKRVAVRQGHQDIDFDYFAHRHLGAYVDPRENPVPVARPQHSSSEWTIVDGSGLPQLEGFVMVMPTFSSLFRRVFERAAESEHLPLQRYSERGPESALLERVVLEVEAKFELRLEELRRELDEVRESVANKGTARFLTAESEFVPLTLSTWVERNLALLPSLAGRWIAIDPRTHEVVANEATAAELECRLDELEAEDEDLEALTVSVDTLISVD